MIHKAFDEQVTILVPWGEKNAPNNTLSAYLKF